MFSMDSLPGDSGVELVGTMVDGIRGIKGIPAGFDPAVR